MTDRSFLDSNIFVYVFDTGSPRKQSIAQDILRRAVLSGRASLSTQVLKEFYVTATRKLQRPLDPKEALRAAKNFAALHVVQIDPHMIIKAIELSQAEQTSFWDGLIIQAALDSGCRALLSEDLQHGRHYGSLRIENPFLRQP